MIDIINKVNNIKMPAIYTAVFSFVTQRSSPLTVSGEERCVTTLKTAV